MITQCRPGRRCKQWRVCEACARIRQAQIASIAEEGARSSPRVTYAVVRTYHPQTIGADREAMVARLSKITEGGIWTIETGAVSAGLHINIIAGTLDGLTAAAIAKAWPSASDADVWAADIPRRDVRHVAAYASKRKGFPHPAEYSGRLYGSWGAWKRPLASIAEDRETPPEVAGAAVEEMLRGAGIPDPEPIPEPRFMPPTIEAPPYRPESPEEKAARMARNKAAWEKAQSQHTAEKARVERENRLRRLYAAYLDEITLNGFCYIPGHGIATIEDARKLGL